MSKKNQRGFLLIEAMIAILIFCLGILGMVAMGGTAIGAQSDARYRSDAAALAETIADRITLDVARFRPPLETVPPAGPVKPVSLKTYEHLPTGDVATCAFSGAASEKTTVLDWVDQVRTTGPGLPGLPGVTTEMQQIVVTDTGTVGGFNRVQITVCWRAPTDTAMRRHTLVTYIN
ncbi:MAG: prepilin-type N-terminal cleavage/methylation domain-containing protein [Burkholderiaceae bacterium]